MAGPPARPSRRRRLTLRSLLRVRRLERVSGRARRSRLDSRELAAFRRANAYWIADWERRRAGAQPTRFGSTASGRLCASTRRARHQADRRRPDLRRSRQRRPCDPPGALSEGALAGAPPDKLGPGDSTGATRSSTGTRLPGRATAGGSSGCVGPSRCTTSPGSITSAALRRSGRSRRARMSSTRAGRWLPRARRVGLPRGEAELGELPVIAEDLGMITKDVEVLRDALGRHGRAPLGVPGADEQSAPAREPPRAPGDLHDNPRYGHVARPPAGPRAVGADRAGASPHAPPCA